MNAISPAAKNVLGLPLEPCSTDPMTGVLRDGCCSHHPLDRGRHMICAVMTEAFLAFTLSRGNDLTTPYPEFGFPGLKPGDRWCVCIDRWVEARNFGVAPPVDLRATHHSVLASVPLADLKVHTSLGGRIVRSTVAANGFARPS